MTFGQLAMLGCALPLYFLHSLWVCNIINSRTWKHISRNVVSNQGLSIVTRKHRMHFHIHAIPLSVHTRWWDFEQQKFKPSIEAIDHFYMILERLRIVFKYYTSRISFSIILIIWARTIFLAMLYIWSSVHAGHWFTSSSHMQLCSQTHSIVMAKSKWLEVNSRWKTVIGLEFLK